MGRDTVIPWLPLPELMTTGIGQPLILASEPSGAALARMATSEPKVSSKGPAYLGALGIISPSCEMAVLHSIWREITSLISLRSTQSANSRISFTFKEGFVRTGGLLRLFVIRTENNLAVFTIFVILL